MGKLNAKLVDSLDKPGTYEDGEGLRLVVQISGRKSWVLRFQLAGRRREMGLGGFPQVSLKEARLKTATCRRQLLDGIDPLAARDAEREALRASQPSKTQDTTFEEAARQYFETHHSGWSEKWRKGWIRKLELYAFSRIGKVAVSKVGTDEVLSVLRPMWTAKNRTADEVRSQIEQIVDAAKARRLRTGENPARWRGHLDSLLSRSDKKKARKQTSFTAIPWQDAPKLIQELQSLNTRDANAMQLLIMTGSRSLMVRYARWDEFNFKDRTWSLSAERMKARSAFVVPLADKVVELLKSIPRVDDSPYLFPGQGRSGVMHADAMRNLIQIDLGRESITCHGFRSTFRDWAGECTSYPRQICELALAHDERGQTESAYSRSNFLEKRRALMADWANFLFSN
ncbi:integrase arm-type DNA-binding domain-containing protein [Pseudomonas sp. PDM23]|uniref:tyrosine-type recombinase/integrase n=1 Tax=Pseudomonas sp. PDM23 TaxID=2769275 RepID=UPI001782E9E0|nr:site-specific integrase [Pseudomonas sp. PDM23]MBD9574835.1 integrase arm-type DNA-binding domain-containing protein [Pseudomonas sp. PDM23]